MLDHQGGIVKAFRMKRGKKTVGTKVLSECQGEIWKLTFNINRMIKLSTINFEERRAVERRW